MLARASIIAFSVAACGRIEFAPHPGDAVDAVDASGDALVTFCSGVQARFCEDFDRGALGAQWDGSAIEPGGALSLDASTVMSSPNALYAASPIAGPYGAEVALQKDFATVFVRGSIELDVRVDSDGDAGTRIVPARIVLGTNFVGIGTHPNSSEITEGVGAAHVLHSASMAIPLATWTHVKLEVDLSASPGTATMAFDGVTVVTTPLDSTTVAGAPRFEVGLPWIEGTNTLWSVDVDNVVFAY